MTRITGGAYLTPSLRGQKVWISGLSLSGRITPIRQYGTDSARNLRYRLATSWIVLQTIPMARFSWSVSARANPEVPQESFGVARERKPEFMARLLVSETLRKDRLKTDLVRTRRV